MKSKERYISEEYFLLELIQNQASIIKWGLTTFLLCGTSLFAQGLGPFTFNVGGGVTPVGGGLHDRLSTGWHVQLGGGYNFTSRLGLNLEYQFNGFGVKSSVLRELEVPAGNANMWSLTLNPVVRLRDPESRFVPYITGGGGYYRRRVEFTEPTTAITNIWDPWWGWIGPVEVPANRVLGRVSRGGGGWNIGAGFTARLGETNTKLYLESRFHYADMTGGIIRTFPVTLGLRW